MKTATEYQAEAAAAFKAAEDSFQRCDTDGFVSQWASNITGRIAMENAKIAEAGGTLTFARPRLARLDGTIVEDAKLCRTRFGLKWRVDADDVWLKVGGTVAHAAKRGFIEVEETVQAPAKAIAWAPPGATGLSGATSVQVRVIRSDIPEWKHDKELWRVVR